MVFNRRNRNPSIAERQFSVSEWNDAPIEQVTGSAHPSSPSTEGSTSSCTGSPGVGVHSTDEVSLPSGIQHPPPLSSSDDILPPATPEINLHSVYNAISSRKSNSPNSPLDESDYLSSAAAPSHQNQNQRQGGRRHSQSIWDNDPQASTRKSRRPTVTKLFHRKSSMDMGGSTVAPSSSASRTSYSSSAGTNIWTKLLGGNSTLWDGIDGKDAFDDADDYSDDGGLDNSSHIGGMYYGTKEEHLKTCKTAMRRVGLSWWYEIRHFMKTVWNHPHIWMVSLLSFGILFGVGMFAINAERDRYIKKQTMTADFIVSCIYLLGDLRGRLFYDHIMCLTRSPLSVSHPFSPFPIPSINPSH